MRARFIILVSGFVTILLCHSFNAPLTVGLPAFIALMVMLDLLTREDDL